MNKKIYIKDWLEFKPYEKQTTTDNYYLKICNEVKSSILTAKHSFVLNMYLDNVGMDGLACFLTSYFEDLISETNIWNTFVKIHKRLYKKQLPFYNLDEYYEEEINKQDICFLIWYYINSVQEEDLIEPYNDFIYEIAENVMEVFEEVWEYAPENKYIKNFYEINKNELDFYFARNLIDTILFDTYLFYPDTLLNLVEEENKIIEKYKNDKNIMMLLNDNRDSILHKSCTRLLGLKGKEWASEILGNNHILSGDFLNMSQKINGFFLYKGQDDNDVFIEHIASGKKFNLTKKSYSYYKDLREIDTILILGIVKWRDEWWFSGVSTQTPFNADLILDEKNSLKSRMAVNFLDHQVKDTNEILEQQFKAFKDFNNGSQIVFMSSDKVEDYIKKYTEYYNNSLKLSKEENEEATKRAREDGYFGTEENHRIYSDVSETALVFFNPKSGAEIALGVNSAFPLPNNPYFDIKQSDDDTLFLLVSEELSKELVLYCIDNCKDKLPFFKEDTGKKYLEDIDFLLRFWKKGTYYTKPAITFTR